MADWSGPVTPIQKTLSPGSTIFQAESLALLEALRWLATYGRLYQSGEIYSDSLARFFPDAELRREREEQIAVG